MTQRLDKINKQYNENRFEAQTRTLTQIDPKSNKNESETNSSDKMGRLQSPMHLYV